MTYSVTKLITEAYNSSSVVSRQFETIQGYQLNDGLLWLNQLLGDKALDSGDIPYITQQYAFNAVVGQETYFIPGLASIDALVFYIGSVRYQMNYVDRIKYFGSPRANNINALPVSYTYERVPGGCNIWVYFWPQQAFEFNVTGNFFIDSVTLNQDLQSKVTTANLGVASVVLPGTISAGQLVVNGVDLAGTYADALALATYINTGIVVNVTASLINFEFVLSSVSGKTITIVTSGILNAPVLGQITFRDFSLQDGYFSQNFYALVFDAFYTNYLEYQLSERICQKLNFAVPDGVADQLARYKLQISKMAEPLDLRYQKISVLGQIKGINYAAVNIGRGYTTGGL